MFIIVLRHQSDRTWLTVSRRHRSESSLQSLWSLCGLSRGVPPGPFRRAVRGAHRTPTTSRPALEASCVSSSVICVTRRLIAHPPFPHPRADAAATEYGAANRRPPMAEAVVWAYRATDALSRQVERVDARPTSTQRRCQGDQREIDESRVSCLLLGRLIGNVHWETCA